MLTYDCYGKCSEDDSGIFVLYADHLADKEAAMDCRKFERDLLFEQITALTAEIEAWHTVFGTTQLSHASERMIGLERELAALTAENRRLWEVLEIPCPWPDDIWTMTDEEYMKAVPDPNQRTAISGFLMRQGWELFRQEALRSKEVRDERNG